MSTPMNLRSGRSLMRRDSRNLEEFQERRKYQREQRAIEDSIYDDEEDENTLAKKMKRFNHKLRHLIYLNNFQVKEKHTFNEKMKNIIDIFEHVRYNMDDLIQYYNNDHKHDKRLLETILQRGHILLLEMYQKKEPEKSTKILKNAKTSFYLYPT